MKKRLLWLLAAVVVLGAGVGWCDHRSRSARAELLSIDGRLPLGVPAERVDEECRRADLRYVRCARSEKRAMVGFGTPLELGAKNWVLWFELADGRVKAKRYRTEDSVEEHPAESPVDAELNGAGVSER